MTHEPAERPTPRKRLAFTRVRLREGYDLAEVDAFMERVHRALESGDGSVTAEDVRNVRFSPVRIRQGYDMGEVDAELDRIAAGLV